MNLNGLWTLMVHQRPPLVITIYDGVVTGGNETYFYTGTVECEGEKMTGNLVGQHYHGDKDTTLGGLGTIHLEVEATVGEESMQGLAKVKGLAQQRNFTGQKRA